MATTLEAEKVSLWHHPNFLKLWGSETISQFGTQFSGLATPYTAVLLTANQDLAKASSEFGILNAAAFIAFPLFALFIGVYVDRHRKRRIMVSANIGRAVSLGLIPLAAVTGTLYTIGLPLLYLVSFFIGLLTVFFDVSYQAILPFLVEREQLVEGNRNLEASRSTAQTIGPGMAGFLLQIIGVVRAPFVIAIDALSYLGSAGFLVRLRNEEQVKPNTASVWHDLREGLAVVLRDTRLRSIAGCTATSNFFSNAIFANFSPVSSSTIEFYPSPYRSDSYCWKHRRLGGCCIILKAGFPVRRRTCHSWLNVCRWNRIRPHFPRQFITRIYSR